MPPHESWRFITLTYEQDIPSGLRNTFVIQSDNWNDFNNYVRFDLKWLDARGLKSSVGKLKILQGNGEKSKWKVLSNSNPPGHFNDDIGSEYISLGQSEIYYGWMHQNFGDEALEILKTLRDISVSPGLANRFETSTVFRNGMMRENVARRSRQFGGEWARGEEPAESPSFAYDCKLSGNEEPFRIDFDFQPSDLLPGRVVGIIGRNAVGKTRFLAQLSADLAQLRRVSAKTVKERKARFPDGQPLFTRIIAVSYSAFDRFRRPSTSTDSISTDSSYVYCGIRDDKGNLTQSGLQRTFRANKSRVRELDRDDDWTECISNILGDANEVSEESLRLEINSDLDESELLDRLSSGQALLCHLVTGLLAWLQPESLILFDEPETHLHPNAVANLFVVLNGILRSHESYAIVATHSPIVIQDIPSNRVIAFSRADGITIASPLHFESFGEDLSELTEHVFKTHEVKSAYRDALEEISKKMEIDEALDLFENNLSMNAKAFLLARYARGKR